MEVRLSRAEYWLLENVVTNTFPLDYLSSEHLDEMLNKPSHGLALAPLTETLVGLFERNWVAASKLKEPSRRMLTREEIATALIQNAEKPAEDPFYYGLTASGGAVWESFAAPNWDWFLDVGLGLSEDGGEFIGASQERLQCYLSLVHHLGCHVRPGSERWDQVVPWQATYWKELPIGHRVRFDFDWEDGRDLHEDPSSVLQLLAEWYNWH
jgi:hypothetical protein